MMVQVFDSLPEELLHLSWQHTNVGSAPRRLEQAGADPRWRTRYLVAFRSDGPIALLAVYQMLKGGRPYRDYDPVLVDPKLFSGMSADPRRWLYIGGRRDYVCGIPVRVDIPPDVAAEAKRALVKGGLEIARRENLHPFAFYVREADLETFTGGSAVSGSVAIDQDATIHVDSGSPDGLPAGLPRRRRQAIRREWRQLAGERIRALRVAAGDIVDEAAPLILAVKANHGMADHPRLISMRLREWVDSAIGPCVAFASRDVDGSLMAVTFACHYGSALEVYEIGMRADVPGRHLHYVEVGIYGPMRYAVENGCETVELGTGSIEPKRLRGALVTSVFAVNFFMDSGSGV